MDDNPLLRLRSYGQSVWLDFIQRSMIESGELQRLITEDGVAGLTSNPAIFAKAMTSSPDYDAAVRTAGSSGKTPSETYEDLVIEDICAAADLFRPRYDGSNATDGYVSLEVSPLHAHDAQATVAEARLLWKRVGRPNVMIKVPGTRECLPAIRQLVAEGINVNVTLLFSLPRYRQVTEAYVAGLADRISQGLAVDKVASVASFFLSRIDTVVDAALDRKPSEAGSVVLLAASLQGEIAIASAKIAYRMFRDQYQEPGFRNLMSRGARPQRLVWASTGTKNPNYSDVKYIESLIGPDTISTMPMETLAAFRDHGVASPQLEEGTDEAKRALELLAKAGIDLNAVTRDLEAEGIRKFVAPYQDVLAVLGEKLSQWAGSHQ